MFFVNLISILFFVLAEYNLELILPSVLHLLRIYLPVHNRPSANFDGSTMAVGRLLSLLSIERLVTIERDDDCKTRK